MTYIALEELNHLWYPDELERFGTLCRQGVGIAEIATALRRSEDEVMVLIIDIKRTGMTTYQLIREHESWDRSITSIYHKAQKTLEEAVATKSKASLSQYFAQRKVKNKIPREKEVRR